MNLMTELQFGEDNLYHRLEVVCNWLPVSDLLVTVYSCSLSSLRGCVSDAFLSISTPVHIVVEI